MAQATQTALKVREHPRKSGIRIGEILNVHRGETFGAAYQVTVPGRVTGRGRERRQFKTREEAETWAEQVHAGHRHQGQDFFALTEAERREITAGIPRLREHGTSISEAIRFAIQHLRPEGRTKALGEVVKELVASKEQRAERGDLRDRSYQDFRQRGERFAEGFEGRIASQVTAEEIKAWLLGLKVGSRSNKNYLSVISEVFKLATQRRYVAFSPLESLTDTDRKELCGGNSEAREPAILTPTEAKKLLNAALGNPKLGLLGAVTLGLFCGLRTEELKRLEWDQVKLADAQPVVTIGAKIAKKRRIRHVEIPPAAVRWLSLVPVRKGPITSNLTTSDHRVRFAKLVKAAGFKKWESNAMRHSFGTYHFALYSNPLETSRLLGHKASDQVLFDHYRALATKEQGNAFFSIVPPAKLEKVIKFA